MMKLVKKLSLIERLALVLSILYGIGVVLLLEHCSLYLGFERIDFLRLKPILVGLQFVIYLFVPFFVFALPVFYVSRIKRPFWIRIPLCVVLILILMASVATMLHYFIPYTTSKGFSKDSWYYYTVTRNFWRLYLYWDIHIVALTLFSASLVMMMKPIQTFMLGHWRWVKNASVIRSIALTFLGIGAVTAMFFFNKDVYMNIRQSAGGGAPIAGIITIANPGEFLTSSNFIYSETENELSKPCFLVEEDSEWFYISEMFGFYGNATFVSVESIPLSICRIPKQNVIQFSPISYYQMWHESLVETIAPALEYDVLQHLSMTVQIQMRPTQPCDSMKLESEAVKCTTNTPVLTLWIDGDGVDVVPARSYHIVPEGGTNLLAKMIFGPLSCLRGRQIAEYRHLLTNSTQRVGLKIDNLPTLPSGFVWGPRLGIGVECNYLYSFDLSEYQPEFSSNGSKTGIHIRKRAFCMDNDQTAKDD